MNEPARNIQSKRYYYNNSRPKITLYSLVKENRTLDLKQSIRLATRTVPSKNRTTLAKCVSYALVFVLKR